MLETNAFNNPKHKHELSYVMLSTKNRVEWNGNIRPVDFNGDRVTDYFFANDVAGNYGALILTRAIVALLTLQKEALSLTLMLAVVTTSAFTVAQVFLTLKILQNMDF